MQEKIPIPHPSVDVCELISVSKALKYSILERLGKSGVQSTYTLNDQGTLKRGYIVSMPY